MAEGKFLQFIPFESRISLDFWTVFNKLKLEKWQLSTDPVEITGLYYNNFRDSTPAHPCGSPPFEVDSTSFTICNAVKEPHLFTSKGILVQESYLEQYRDSDKSLILSKYAEEYIWRHIESKAALDDPSCLSTFVLYMHGNLKTFYYQYWFGFPAFAYSKVKLTKNTQTLKDIWTPTQMTHFMDVYLSRSADVHGAFFVVECLNDSADFKCHPLANYGALYDKGSQVMLGVADPSSNPDAPGWPLRNLLTLIQNTWPNTKFHDVLCLRLKKVDGVWSPEPSLVVSVKLNVPKTPPLCTGWEKSQFSKKYTYTNIDLSSRLDEHQVYDEACRLTLSLMKWRIAPDLNLMKMETAKCLLFGAGTLGCNVARCLLGWGARNITLVDNGKVSMSNPVRQSLYTFNDSKERIKSKALAAEEALKLIVPRANIQGVSLTIPMPGHPPGEGRIAEVSEAVSKIEEIINDHDVIFLLTDSRESRWLPTLLGAAYGKIVITAAIGFDSYVVMRHGCRLPSPLPPAALTQNVGGDCQSQPQPSQEEQDLFSCNAGIMIPGRNLGCYFCNDVQVPANSLTERTLDQQCTVTRPGVSMMASAQAVELMASILQHPLGINAPSARERTDDTSNDGVLGPVFHSIRYFMKRAEIMTPTTPYFKQCSACGAQAIAAYQREKNEFVVKVLNSPAYLEEVSGIKDLKTNLVDENIDFEDSLDCDEDDEEGSDCVEQQILTDSIDELVQETSIDDKIQQELAQDFECMEVNSSKASEAILDESVNESRAASINTSDSSILDTSNTSRKLTVADRIKLSAAHMKNKKAQKTEE